MKRTINTIGLFTFVGLLACLLFLYEVPPHAEAGVGTFRTGIANLLSSEFTTAQSNRIGNAFADQYQGEKHGSAKLTGDQVVAIRDAYKTGIRQQRLADIFNIHQAHVSDIVNYKRWGHI